MYKLVLSCTCVTRRIALEHVRMPTFVKKRPCAFLGVVSPSFDRANKPLAWHSLRGIPVLYLILRFHLSLRSHLKMSLAASTAGTLVAPLCIFNCRLSILTTSLERSTPQAGSLSWRRGLLRTPTWQPWCLCRTSVSDSEAAICSQPF